MNPLKKEECQNNIFDTHCHLCDESYQNENVENIIENSKKEDVAFLLNIGYDRKSNEKVIEQLDLFSILFGAIGIHPNSKDDLNNENLKWIESQLKNNKRIIAIGEIGLDYYRINTEKNEQKRWFKEQLKIAKKYEKIVCLHIRDAFEDAISIIKEVDVKEGILHCFTGNYKIAKEFIDMGFFISFAGNITYENNGWKEKWEELIKKIPLDKILVETDSPYLSPVPMRGKKNYPKNIMYTLKKISLIKKIELVKIKQKIFENSLKILKIKK